MNGLVIGVTALVLATATPTPTVPPSGPLVPKHETAPAATFPVEPLLGDPEALVFGVASQDGAVTDQGNQDFRLNSDVLFAFDQADLTPRARTELNRIAGIVSGRSAGVDGTTKPASHLAVTGFTDSVGPDSYNLALSQRRAEAVRAVLAPALPGVTIEAVGKGEATPIGDNQTKAGQALNRRVEIRAS